MKTTRTSKYIFNKINSFPTVKKEPHRHEVWLALFPYEQLGNMEKLRPVYITSVNEEKDTVRCKMITTNPKNARKIKGKISKSRYWDKECYLKEILMEIPTYKLYGKMKNKIELED